MKDVIKEFALYCSTVSIIIILLMQFLLMWR